MDCYYPYLNTMPALELNYYLCMFLLIITIGMNNR